MVSTGFIFLLLHHVIITLGRPKLSTTSLCGTNGRTYKDKENLKFAQSKETDLQLLHLGPCSTVVRESIIQNLNPGYRGDGQIYASLPDIKMEYVKSKPRILEELIPYHDDIMRIGKLRGEFGNNRIYEPAFYLPNRSFYHSSYQPLKQQSPYMPDLRMSQRLTNSPLHKMTYRSPNQLKYFSDVKSTYPFNSQLHFVSNNQPSNSYSNSYYPNEYYLPHNIREKQFIRYDKSLPGKFDWMHNANHWKSHKNPQREITGSNLKGDNEAEVVNAGINDKGNKETNVGYITKNKFSDLTNGYHENKVKHILGLTNNNLEPSVTPLKLENKIYEGPNPSQLDLLHRHPMFTLSHFLKSPPITKYGFEDYLFASTISHSYLHPIVKSKLLSKYKPPTLAGNVLILTKFVFPGSNSNLQVPFEPFDLYDNILPLPEYMPNCSESNLLHESSDLEIPDSDKNLSSESAPSRLQDELLTELVHPSLDFNEGIIKKNDPENAPGGYILMDQEDNSERGLNSIHNPPLINVLPSSEYNEGSSTDFSLYPLSGNVLPDFKDNTKNSTNTSQNPHIDDASPDLEYDIESGINPPSGDGLSESHNNMKDQSNYFHNLSERQHPHIVLDSEDNIKDITNSYQNPSTQDVFPGLKNNIKGSTNPSHNLYVEDELPGSEYDGEGSIDSSFNSSSRDVFPDSQDNTKDRENYFQNSSAEDAFSSLDNIKDSTNPPQNLYEIDILPSSEDDNGSSIDFYLNPSSGDGSLDLESTIKDTTNPSQNLSAGNIFLDLGDTVKDRENSTQYLYVNDLLLGPEHDNGSSTDLLLNPSPADAFWDLENNTEDKRDPFTYSPLGVILSSSKYNMESSTDISIITPVKDLLPETKDIINDSKNSYQNLDVILPGSEYDIKSSVNPSSNPTSGKVLLDAQADTKEEERRDTFKNPHVGELLPDSEYKVGSSVDPFLNPSTSDVFQDPGDIKNSSINNIREYNMPSSNENNATNSIEEGLVHSGDLHVKGSHFNLDFKYLHSFPDYYFIIHPIRVSQNSSGLGSDLIDLDMENTEEGAVDRSVEEGVQLNMEDNGGENYVNNGDSKEYSEVGSLENDDGGDYHHQYITEVTYDEPCDIQSWFSK